MLGGNSGEGGSMVAWRDGRGSLVGGFGDAGCPLGGSLGVGRNRWGGPPMGQTGACSRLRSGVAI